MPPMKLLLFLLVAAALVLAPFLVLKRPWAVRLWRRVRLLLAIYVLVIIIAAALRLAVNWHDIYG